MPVSHCAWNNSDDDLLVKNINYFQVENKQCVSNLDITEKEHLFSFLVMSIISILRSRLVSLFFFLGVNCVCVLKSKILVAAEKLVFKISQCLIFLGVNCVCILKSKIVMAAEKKISS